jgi:glycosyl transferase family 2
LTDVSVIVATFGDASWKTRGEAAVLSAATQSHQAHVLVSHGDTLSGARNEAAGRTKAEWLVFLDADDALDHHYVEEMLKGTADLRQPATLGVYADGTTDDFPVVISRRPSILDANHLVIGTMVRRELFLSVGGFRPLPVLEDWDLWIRCLLSGATQEAMPQAIYRVGVSRDGRNTSQPELHGRVYGELRVQYWSQVATAGV